jgi:hypothetical protein
MTDRTTMDALAGRLVELSDTKGYCPVLTLESRLSLRPPFFGCLAACLAQQVGRPLRFDLLVHPEGSFALALRWRALREVAKLSTVMPPEASVSVGMTVGRPAGQRRPLVIGVAGESMPLPAWAYRIRLGTQPCDSETIQIVTTVAA